MQLSWLKPGDPFPDPAEALTLEDEIPGLLAAGGSLDVSTLLTAYGSAIFPWFSEGQPILWWSPDPRMVLEPVRFRMHRSFRKTVLQFRANPACEVRINHDFDAVIAACAGAARGGQSGTWIVPEMVRAYGALHRAGHAHSVETWIDGELVGGLYCVAIGRAVFGESMFAWRTDASKIALAALVSFCRHHGVGMIDCQQNTPHLAGLGACQMPRKRFVDHVAIQREGAAPQWRFDPLYWREILPERQFFQT